MRIIDDSMTRSNKVWLYAIAIIANSADLYYCVSEMHALGGTVKHNQSRGVQLKQIQPCYCATRDLPVIIRILLGRGLS
jgi:hypothetical protein